MNHGSVSDSVFTLPRRQRERLERKRAIFAAAERVFAAKDYHKASIEEIARAAEFGTGTVYLYFKDKETLYLELFEEKVRELLDYVEGGIGSEKEPIRALRRLIRARMEFFQRNRAFFRIYTREGPDLWWMKREKWVGVRKIYDGYIRLLTRLISNGQQAGLLRKGDTRRHAVALSGIMSQLSRDWLARKTEEPLTDSVDFIAQLFLRGAEAK